MALLDDPFYADLLADIQGRAAKWDTPGDMAAHVDPRTRQTPALNLIDQALVNLFNTPDGRLIISMPPQEGKALALDTPIATPAGWTTMGDLKVGDQVFGRDGKPCRVTWVSPVWTGRDCYTVTTGDGERIIADGAHEWAARLDRRRGEHIIDTTCLAKKRSKNAQVTGASLDLPAADLPLDPYVLGAWLGDGHSQSARITIHPDDIQILDRIKDAGYSYVQQGQMNWSLAGVVRIANGTGRRSVLRDKLVHLNVWGNKHIPDLYQRGSTEQRLALLQGLVDTDGYVSPKGQVEFCATNKVLAEGVRDLVFSLGAKAVMTEGRATINGKDCGPKYRVRFYLARAAYLDRKAKRCRDSSVGSVRYVKADLCESVPTVCIEVDSPDHMFLAGHTLLPTHNSTRVSKDFPIWALTQNPELRIVTASYAQSLANRNGRAVRNTIQSSPDLGLHIAQDHGAVSEWSLANHSGGVRSVGRGAGITGFPADLLIIDDPLKDRAEADSATIRDTCMDWWTDSLSTRLAPGAQVVLILTRWHEDDLAGRLLNAEDGHLWNVINIPAQADSDDDQLGRQPGEYMMSARGRTPAQWEATKIRVGSRTWAALFQGHPSPAEGGMLKRDWWQEYPDPLAYARDDGTWWTYAKDAEIIQSWDMAFKGTDHSDFVCGQVWARIEGRAYLLDQVHGRYDFVETLNQFRRLTAKWPQAVLKIVEDKANGPAVITSLSREIPGIVPDTPDGGKEARVSAISPLVEAGNVWLPSPELAPWIGGFIEEAAAFPTGTHDDQVDALSQALKRLILMPLQTGGMYTADDLFDVDSDFSYADSPY